MKSNAAGKTGIAKDRSPKKNVLIFVRIFIF
jgi:hypothetical protein